MNRKEYTAADRVHRKTVWATWNTQRLDFTEPRPPLELKNSGMAMTHDGTHTPGAMWAQWMQWAADVRRSSGHRGLHAARLQAAAQLRARAGSLP